MSFSNYAEEQALNVVLTGAYVALVTTTPTETAPGTEVSAGEYARQALGAFTVTQGDPTQAVNDAVIEFPAATSAWGTVTYAVLFDALSGGNYLGYLQLRDPNNTSNPLSKTVTSGDILRFTAGQLVFTQD